MKRQYKTKNDAGRVYTATPAASQRIGAGIFAIFSYILYLSSLKKERVFYMKRVSFFCFYFFPVIYFFICHNISRNKKHTKKPRRKKDMKNKLFQKIIITLAEESNEYSSFVIMRNDIVDVLLQSKIVAHKNEYGIRFECILECISNITGELLDTKNIGNTFFIVWDDMQQFLNDVNNGDYDFIVKNIDNDVINQIKKLADEMEELK